MIPPRALLFAAGHGTRLRPLTDSVPKCLAPIGRRPLLDYWLMQLAAAGVRHMVINTHHLRQPVLTYAAAVNRRGGQRITESFEPKLLGTAGTISANRALATGGDDLFLIYADNYSGVDLAAMLEFHRAHGAAVTMMLFRTNNPEACGIAEVSADGWVIGFEEKPAQPRSNLANAGVLLMKAPMFRAIADMGAFDLARDVLPRILSHVRGWTYDGCHTDIGTQEGYARARFVAAHLTLSGSIDAAGLRPAVFLDRDGLLIEHPPCVSSAVRPRPLNGAIQAIRTLRRAGYACIVLAPDGDADGPFAMNSLLNDEMCEVFADGGAVFDAICGHPRIASSSGDREREGAVEAAAIAGAADDMQLDLSRSWRVGLTSAAPTNRAGTVGDDRLYIASARTASSMTSMFARCADLERAVTLLTECASVPHAAAT